MSTIEASGLTEVLNFLKGLSDKIFKYLNSSETKKIIKVEKVEEEKSGVKKLTLKYKNKIPTYVKLKDTGNETFDMEVSVAGNDGKAMKFKRVREDEFDDKLKEAYDELLDDDLLKSFGLTASKEIKVSLKKVCGSKDTSIQLCAITANYDIAEANSMLDIVLDNETFVNSIPEDLTSYSIIDEGEELDITEIDDIDSPDLVEDSLYQMLCAAIQFNMEMQVFHWECAFNEQLFNITGDLLYQSQYDVNQIGLWIVQNCNSVVSPFNQEFPDAWFNQCDLATPHSPQIESVGIEHIFDSIDVYLDTLDFFYPNFEHDMQFEIDRMIRSLKDIRDWRLKQI